MKGNLLIFFYKTFETEYNLISFIWNSGHNQKQNMLLFFQRLNYLYYVVGADTIKIFNFTRSSLCTKSNFKLRDTFCTKIPIFGISHSQTGCQKVTSILSTFPIAAIFAKCNFKSKHENICQWLIEFRKWQMLKLTSWLWYKYSLTLNWLNIWWLTSGACTRKKKKTTGHRTK